MKKEACIIIDDITLSYGRRKLIYTPTGFIYFYKNIEKGNVNYHIKRFTKAVKKHIKIKPLHSKWTYIKVEFF